MNYFFHNGFMNMRNLIFIGLFLNTLITKEISSFEEMIEDLCGLGIGHSMIQSIFIVHPLCAKHILGDGNAANNTK